MINILYKYITQTHLFEYFFDILFHCKWRRNVYTWGQNVLLSHLNVTKNYYR